MHKLILFSLLTFSVSNVFASNASYQVKYPLSAGAFKTTQTTPTSPPPVVPAPKPDSTCIYDYPSTYWLAGLNGSYDILSVTENGKVVGNPKGYQTTSFVYNGITYSRGVSKAGQGAYTRYEVCKTK